MTKDQLLSVLETFVHQAVEIGPGAGLPDTLQARLDVLERVAELLRLRAGWSEHRIPIERLIEAGMDIETGQAGATVLRVGVPSRTSTGQQWQPPDERTQGELQAPLLLYLLRRRHTGMRVGNLILEFVNALRPYLSAADVETTETGVTRVMTTARIAARTLRDYGLLTDTKATAYRTWQLSLLGVLVAVRLQDGKHTLAMEQRQRAVSDPAGPFGGTNMLAAPVREAMSRLADPAQVVGTLQRLSEPNTGAFDTVGPALDALATYCARLEPGGQPPVGSLAELRVAARAMLAAVDEAVPAELLAEELAKRLALQELPASM